MYHRFSNIPETVHARRLGVTQLRTETRTAGHLQLHPGRHAAGIIMPLASHAAGHSSGPGPGMASRARLFPTGTLSGTQGRLRAQPPRRNGPVLANFNEASGGRLGRNRPRAMSPGPARPSGPAGRPTLFYRSMNSFTGYAVPISHDVSEVLVDRCRRC